MIIHILARLLLACFTTTCALPDASQLAIDYAGDINHAGDIDHAGNANYNVKAVMTKKKAVLCKTVSKCPSYLERVLEVRRFSLNLQAEPEMATVRVKAAAANPIDFQRIMRPGWAPPGTLFGFEMAGVVVDAGPDCHQTLGSPVYGTAFPAFSTYVKVHCKHVAYKPSTLNFTEAAAMPVAALKGLEAFHKTGAPWKTSPTVLVIGGSGGTGHLGIQLAKALGAGRVITTCSSGNIDFVKDLGADWAIDYKTQKWWKVLKKGSVDIIYDCVGLTGAAVHAYGVLADGGKYITEFGKLARKAVAATRPSVKQIKFTMTQNSEFYLDQLTRLTYRGLLRPRIHKTYEGLASVPEMLTELMKGHVAGKLVVTI